MLDYLKWLACMGQAGDGGRMDRHPEADARRFTEDIRYPRPTAANPDAVVIGRRITLRGIEYINNTRPAGCPWECDIPGAPSQFKPGEPKRFPK